MHLGLHLSLRDTTSIFGDQFRRFYFVENEKLATDSWEEIHLLRQFGKRIPESGTSRKRAFSHFVLSSILLVNIKAS